MLLIARLVGLFPLALVLFNLFALGVFAAGPSVFTAAFLFFALYLVAPLAFRIHDLFWPLNEGVSRLDDPKSYSAWWAANRFQAFYEALPFLESLLRLIPGVYSFWLRLWGAEVGYGVRWPTRLDLLDRPLMVIGNRVIFGHDVQACAHAIRQTEGEVRVLAKRIHIGDRVRLGASVRLEPGARAPRGAVAPAGARIGLNGTFGGEARHASPEEAAFAAEEQGDLG